MGIEGLEGPKSFGDQKCFTMPQVWSSLLSLLSEVSLDEVFPGAEEGARDLEEPETITTWPRRD